MQTLSAVVGFGVFVPLVVLFNALTAIYIVDLVLDGWLLVLIFLGPLMLTVIWWAVLAAYTPLAMAVSDEATTTQRMFSLVAVPIGLGLAFMLWQAQNWIVYGLMNADPELYNWVFKHVGLSI